MGFVALAEYGTRPILTYSGRMMRLVPDPDSGERLSYIHVEDEADSHPNHK